MISEKNFTGEFPRAKEYDLPDNAAQYALDCDFTRGSLIGIRDRKSGKTVASGTKSLFIYDDNVVSNFYSWTTDVDAVKGPITDDTYNRFYWANGTNFYVSTNAAQSGGSPSNYWKVGVPKPANPPSRATEQKFKIPGFASFGDALWDNSYDFVIAKEDESGAVISEQAVTMTIVEQSEEMVYLSSTIAMTFDPVTSTVETTTDVTVDGITTTTPITQTTSKPVTPMVKIFMRTDTGMVCCALIRPGSVKNNWPAEAFGFNADLDVQGTTLYVRIFATQAYRQERAYVYTYVNEFGEEGPPSEPFLTSLVDGQILKLRYTPYASTGNGDYKPISKVRFYRTNVSGTFCLIDDGTHPMGIDHTTHADPELNHIIDGVITANLVEPLSSQGYYPPPQNLVGVCRLPNGIMAGFVKGDTRVLFSENYLPYAWNPDNAQKTEGSVVGLCPYEAYLYVTTRSNPLLVSGVSPDAMTMQKIPAIQAGVSKGSICNAGPFVVYASNDGLVVARGLDAGLDYSEQFFTRNVWRDRYKAKLDKMRLSAHDGRVVVWFEDGTPGFLLRLDENKPSMTELSDAVTAAFVSPESDALYVVSGTTAYEFNGLTTTHTATWWSKDLILPKPMNFGAYQLVGSGTCTLKSYADGVLKDTKSITLDSKGMVVGRLSSGFLARRWSFRIELAANSEITEANFAVSPSEFRNV